MQTIEAVRFGVAHLLLQASKRDMYWYGKMDLIFNIVDLAKVEDEVISVDFVAIFEVGTSDISVRGVWEEVMWGSLWDR